jgi:hypothetical protein
MNAAMETALYTALWRYLVTVIVQTNPTILDTARSMAMLTTI